MTFDIIDNEKYNKIMKPIDLSRLLSKKKSGWIALTPNNRKFLASAKTLKAVVTKANKLGVSNPTVFKSINPRYLAVG